MLERLIIKGLELNNKCISVLDLYCSQSAGMFADEGKIYRHRPQFFDNFTQVAIGPREQIDPIRLVSDYSAKNFRLLERNEFYGIDINGKNAFLPEQVLADCFGIVYMDAPQELFKSILGEREDLRNEYLKSVWHKGQIGKEFQFEFPPNIALEVTKRLRDYLPAEILKCVTYHGKEIAKAS